MHLHFCIYICICICICIHICICSCICISLCIFCSCLRESSKLSHCCWWCHSASSPVFVCNFYCICILVCIGICICICICVCICIYIYIWRKVEIELLLLLRPSLVDHFDRGRFITHVARCQMNQRKHLSIGLDRDFLFLASSVDMGVKRRFVNRLQWYCQLEKICLSILPKFSNGATIFSKLGENGLF